MDTYEKYWFQFKEYINSKPNHGKNDLLRKMVELELERLSDFKPVKAHKNNNFMTIDISDAIRGVMEDNK